VTSSPAIRTEGLSKFYGPSRGIEGLDLEIHQGEVFGFLGPNGAGKTTTIRVLLDLIRPTSGRAEILGLDTRRESFEARRRTGYLPGELKLPPRPTPRKFLSYMARLRGGVPAARVERLAERLGLELDRQIGELSKGNREKVGVVGAFMHDPELLILDEPTSGLDPLRQQDVQELIRERAAAGRTVFLSSHALDQVEHVAQRIAIIREGRLITVEEVSALKERALRRVEVRFAEPIETEALRRVPGVRDFVADGQVVHLHVEGPMDALIKELAHYPVRTMLSEEPELDEIFLAYYGRAHGD
jgi:ABC-2 type transport system ATP-binding protein